MIKGTVHVKLARFAIIQGKSPQFDKNSNLGRKILAFQPSNVWELERPKFAYATLQKD